MADVPTLDQVTVIGRQYDYMLERQQQQSLIDYYRNIANFAWQSLALQPDYVQVWQPPTVPIPVMPPTTITADPDELEFEPTGIDDEGEGIELGSPGSEIPTWAMNDEEYVDFLGGGDAAYEQVWRERHPYDTGNDRGYSFDDFIPNEKMFLPWAPVIVPSIIRTITAPLLPWIFPFLPTPMGPREADEAPNPGGVRSPPRLPPNVPLDPIMPPNWEDIANTPYEFTVDRPALGPIPDTRRTPRIRPILPISDDPGMLPFDFGFPDLAPFTPLPGPRTRPAPDPVRTAPDPFSDPVPLRFPDPFGFPAPEPFPFPGPARYPDPRPFAPPIGAPFPEPFPLPPGIGQPGTPGQPLPMPPPGLLPELPLDPFSSPFMPPGVPTQRADPCNCEGKKKKKKKKQRDREICYRGTYIERSKGLTKRRIERVPCATKPRS